MASPSHCSLHRLEQHWRELQAIGVAVPEVIGFKPRISNLAEGGTNTAEFAEEVAIAAAAAAHRARERGTPPLRMACQTGFNAGVSALALLCALPNAMVHSFDLGVHPYVVPAARLLDRDYFGRHKLTLGSSLETLPAMHRNLTSPGARVPYCDYVFVDGGHSFDVAMADLRNFRSLTTPKTTVVVENCNASTVPPVLKPNGASVCW